MGSFFGVLYSRYSGGEGVGERALTQTVPMATWLWKTFTFTVCIKCVKALLSLTFL